MTKAKKITAAPVAETAIELVELALLERAPENVRHTREDEDVAELADDIAAHGLLQSLIGYRKPNEACVFIAGGGRRLKALELLLGRGAVTGKYHVPVLVRPREEAVELSLAENLARRDMSPADEFVAFSLLMESGTHSTADLARRFGFTERYVKQRLRLAALAPEILDALRERKITLDAAMAYASTQDRALQSATFKAHSRPNAWDAHKPEKVRRDISGAGMDEGDAPFKFIGAKAYERAGGGYEDDLFSEAGGDRGLTNPAMVRQLAQDHIDFQMVKRLSELQKDHPSIRGYLVVPSLELHAWGTSDWPKVPDGFDWVDKYDEAKVWSVIDNNKIDAHVVVGIDPEGQLAVWMRKVAVPKKQVSAIMGAPNQQPGYTPMSQEEIDRKNREREGARWAQRLAIPGLKPREEGDSFEGTPLQGRVFWPDAWRDDRKEVDHPELGKGWFVPICVFVTEEEVSAKAEAGLVRYDKEKADEERRKAEKAAEREAREKAENERRIEWLSGLEAKPPAVIEVADWGCGALFRQGTEGFTYLDVEPGEDPALAEFSIEDVEQLAAEDDAGVLTWATVDDWRAHHSEKPGAETSDPVPGVCRVCGCVEEAACQTAEGPCAWANEERTLCDSPDCLAVAQFEADEIQPEPVLETEPAE